MEHSIRGRLGNANFRALTSDLRVNKLSIGRLGLAAALSLGCGSAELINGPTVDPISVGLSLQVQAGPIAGTLVQPAEGKSWPVALIISGSGNTDRDGNPAGGPKNDCLRLLADSLARNGIASVRYDKRGVGASATLVRSEIDLTFDLYVGDAAAWLAMLSKDSRFSRVIVIGHSEGALIGTLAAQRQSVFAVITLEGAGRPAGDVILDQISPALSSAQLTAVRGVIFQLDSGRLVPVLPPEIPTDLAFALFRPSVQPYLISWFKYDPAVELSRVAHASIRALALAGTSDLQVFTVDGERLATASGNRLASIDNMTHVLREATRDPADNARTYSNPSLPLARGLVSTLAGFIRSGSY